MRGATLAAGCLMGILFLTGCDNGGDDGGDGAGEAGSNNPGVIVCLGDSITEGTPAGGAPFPSRLAAQTGKTVINAGKGGEKSGSGAARARSVLQQHKPAVMTILYGANDVIMDQGNDEVIANLNAIISLCRENQTKPVLATLPPMVMGHSIWNGQVTVLNDMIRELASATGVSLVDLEQEFGSEPYMLLAPDGLHPNDTGNMVIADAFAGKL